jgi:hypothetical protein
MMMRGLILLVCLSGSSGVFSQFTDSARHFIGYTGTGIINNTETSHAYLFRNSLQAGLNRGNLSANGISTWVYGRQNKLRTNNDYENAVDIDYRIDSSRFKVWVLGTYDKSFSLKINKRLQAGTGLSYDVFRKNGNRLNLSNGILYESSDLMLLDGTKDVYKTWRNSFRLKYIFHIGKVFEITGTHFLQNSLSEKNDYNIRSQSGLGVKVFSWASITTAVTFNKLNRLHRENFLLTFGVNLRKYF